MINKEKIKNYRRIRDILGEFNKFPDFSRSVFPFIGRTELQNLAIRTVKETLKRSQSTKEENHERIF